MQLDHITLFFPAFLYTSESDTLNQITYLTIKDCNNRSIIVNEELFDAIIERAEKAKTK